MAQRHSDEFKRDAVRIALRRPELNRDRSSRYLSADVRRHRHPRKVMLGTGHQQQSVDRVVL